LGRSARRLYDGKIMTDDGKIMTAADFDIAAQDGTRLHGRAWSVDAPVAVVNLIHGLGEHSGRYDHLAGYLNAQNISVYAVDLHGHGRTPGKRGVAKDIPTLIGDVSALLEFSRLQNPDAPHILMGHSMGGNIVLSYGLKYPASPYKAIVAQAPLIKPAEKVPGILKTIMSGLVKVAPNIALKAKLDKEKISTLPHEQETYITDPLNHGYLGGKLALSLFEHCEAIEKSADVYPYDVLVTHGTQDRLTDFAASRDFAARCPRADFIAYEGSAHEIHNDLHRDKVYADLSGWLLQKI